MFDKYRIIAMTDCEGQIKKQKTYMKLVNENKIIS